MVGIPTKTYPPIRKTRFVGHAVTPVTHTYGGCYGPGARKPHKPEQSDRNAIVAVGALKQILLTEMSN